MRRRGYTQWTRFLAIPLLFKWITKVVTLFTGPAARSLPGGCDYARFGLPASNPRARQTPRRQLWRD